MKTTIEGLVQMIDDLIACYLNNYDIDACITEKAKTVGAVDALKRLKSELIPEVGYDNLREKPIVVNNEDDTAQKKVKICYCLRSGDHKIFIGLYKGKEMYRWLMLYDLYMSTDNDEKKRIYNSHNTSVGWWDYI